MILSSHISVCINLFSSRGGKIFQYLFRLLKKLRKLKSIEKANEDALGDASKSKTRTGRGFLRFLVSSSRPASYTPAAKMCADAARAGHGDDSGLSS